MIIRDTNLLHPKFRGAVNALADDLIRAYEAEQTQTLFKVFETVRSCERQDDLFVKGSTKARPWQSAHQFGLAVDFVAVIDRDQAHRLGDMIGEKVLEGWSWDRHHDWPFLKMKAEKHGLRVPLAWDRVHVESPIWPELRKTLRMLTGH